MKRPRRGGWQGWGIGVLLLLVVVPSLTSGATSVGTFSGSPYRAVQVVPSGPPPVAIGAQQVLLLGGAATGYAAAGVQSASPGDQGATALLAPCAKACTQNYRPASSPALVAGNFAEQFTFTVTQPRHAGPATGFDVEVAVLLTPGWVVGRGYFSTGVAPGPMTSLITLQIFLDLGAALPTVTAIRLTVNACTSTAGCP